MDWNNYNYTGNDGNGDNSVKNALKSLGRNTFRASKRATGKGLKWGAGKVADAAKKSGSLLSKVISPKGMLKLGILIIILVLIISMVYSCNFYITGETDGQEGNYVDNDNTPASGSSGSNTNANGDKNLSVSNAACLAYYTMLSKEKSCWQEKTDADGNVTLLQYGSTDSVSDSFGNDENYFINPNLLFAMNKYLYPNDYVFPEAFLKPVAYKKDKNGKYSLEQLTDSTGKVVVSSEIYSEDGEKTGQTNYSVSDYGIGSVIIYKEVNKSNELKGKYVKEDYYDSVSGEVKQRTIDESFLVIIDNTVENVISTAITFAGVIDFTYESDTALSMAVSDGESSSETENVSKILYDTQTVTQYYATATGGSIKYFSDTKSLENFVKKNPVFSAAKTADGKYKEISNTYNLYKYRSSDSGVYTNFVKKKDSKVRDESTKYLYDYLENFTTYKPIMSRTNDTFRNFNSSVTAGELTTASLSEDDTTIGSGSNDFEMLYNGNKKKIIEEIWDGLINYGFSKEQTAAILGNMTQESGFKTDAEDGSGAYGLCQFMNSRKDKLFTFTKDYNKKSEPDTRSQIQFISMEVLGGGKWADNPWVGHEDDQNTFNTSNSIDDLTKAFCDGCERPAKWAANLSKRQKCARSAYKILKNRTVKPDKKIKVKDGTSGTSDTVNSSSGGLSEEEQAEYNYFYHMVDNIYDGKYTLEDYYGGLTKDQADLVIKTANSYINGTTLTEESLKIDDQMWSKTYLSDLAQKDISISGSPKDNNDIFVAYKGEYVLPVSSRVITDDYGPRSAPVSGASTDHKGIDIAATYGEPVRAAKDGVVTVAEYGSSGGNYVIIDHGKDSSGNTIWTMYCHNSRLCVKVGDKVKQGQKIAEAGSTGVSTGVHCHLSVFKNGEYDNPHKYFDFSK